MKLIGKFLEGTSLSRLGSPGIVAKGLVTSILVSVSDCESIEFSGM